MTCCGTLILKTLSPDDSLFRFIRLKKIITDNKSDEPLRFNNINQLQNISFSLPVMNKQSPIR